MSTPSTRKIGQFLANCKVAAEPEILGPDWHNSEHRHNFPGRFLTEGGKITFWGVFGNSQGRQARPDG